MRRSTWFLIGFNVLATASLGWSANVLPDFANIPAGWVTDRYEPNSFTNIGAFQGHNNVLEIGITAAEGLNNRPAAFQSTFYNTQGRQTPTPGGPGDFLSAELYIPSSYLTGVGGNERTDLWGVTTDGAVVPQLDFPIIGFTNYGGLARYRVWESNINDWVDLATPVQYDTWTSFAINFTGAAYVYDINGTTVYTDNTINGSIGFKDAILQAYNFNGDPSLAGAVGGDYTANWSNLRVVPEPSFYGVLAIAMAGLFLAARRRAA